jgi:homoserine kinase
VAEATAPGSSANLGPGFDTLALALEMTCRVVATPAEDWKVTHHGRHAPGSGEDDAVLMAAQAAVGSDHPLELDVHNEIPLGRGLGSSAAAFVAGAAAGLRAVEDDMDLHRVLEVAADLEGHLDNVAASVFGGLVAAVGTVVQSLQLHPSLRFVVAVPARRLPTKWARRALPEIVEHDVATRSVARVVALVEAFRTADAGLFSAAAGDELHEAPRSSLFPEADDLISVARSAGALHACWSGAGPSILAVVGDEQANPVAAALSEALGSEGTVLHPEVALRGVR